MSSFPAAKCRHKLENPHSWHRHSANDGLSQHLLAASEQTMYVTGENPKESAHVAYMNLSLLYSFWDLPLIWLKYNSLRIRRFGD
jgi:hypothetical protein